MPSSSVYSLNLVKSHASAESSFPCKMLPDGNTLTGGSNNHQQNFSFLFFDCNRNVYVLRILVAPSTTEGKCAKKSIDQLHVSSPLNHLQLCLHSITSASRQKCRKPAICFVVKTCSGSHEQNNQTPPLCLN